MATILRATKKAIHDAAAIIRGGGLVAFPTETVYGLGANAFVEEAIRKIFQAKGRPSANPIIIHISTITDLPLVAEHIPQVALVLAQKFWPGPLTLILQKKAAVPLVATAGLPTIAVRVPDHAVAQALMRAAGVPIAAPSANLSGKPSATTAAHVAADFGDAVDMILDGGRTRIGLESTVVDCTVSPPMVLRQGGIPIEDLRCVVPAIVLVEKGSVLAQKSPGTRYRHYAPRAPLIIAMHDTEAMVQEIQQFIAAHAGARVGVLATKEFASQYTGATVLTVGSRKNLNGCAAQLFATLRQFDTLGVDFIISERFPTQGIGAAIMDRLRRAAE